MADRTRIPVKPSELVAFMDNTDNYQTNDVPPVNYTRWQWTDDESAQWHAYRQGYDDIYVQLMDSKHQNTAVVDAEAILNKAIHAYDNDPLTGHHLLDKIALFGTTEDCEVFLVKRGTVLADTNKSRLVLPEVDMVITVHTSKHLFSKLEVVASGQNGRAKPKGVKEVMVFKAVTPLKSAAPPLSAYHYVGDVSRGLISVQHDESDEGNTAWFIVRLKSGSGQLGQASAAISVTVM